MNGKSQREEKRKTWELREYVSLGNQINGIMSVVFELRQEHPQGEGLPSLPPLSYWLMLAFTNSTRLPPPHPLPPPPASHIIFFLHRVLPSLCSSSSSISSSSSSWIPPSSHPQRALSLTVLSFYDLLSHVLRSGREFLWSSYPIARVCFPQEPGRSDPLSGTCRTDQSTPLECFVLWVQCRLCRGVKTCHYMMGLNINRPEPLWTQRRQTPKDIEPRQVRRHVCSILIEQKCRKPRFLFIIDE